MPRCRCRMRMPFGWGFVFLLGVAAVFHPFYEAEGPGVFGDGDGADAEAVAALVVDVEFGVDVGFFELEVDVGEAFGDVGAVVVGAAEEGGGRIFVDDDVFGLAGVDESLEVGFGVEAVDGVVGLFGFFALLDELDGDFAAGGEAHDADLGGVDAPFVGAAADEADGAAGVDDGFAVDLVFGAGGAGEAVFEDECGDAVVREELGDVVAFVVDGEEHVSAAGGDDDGGDGAFGVFGEVGGDGGVIDVGDDGEGGGGFDAPVDDVRGILTCALGAGGGGVPEGDFGGVGVHVGGGGFGGVGFGGGGGRGGLLGAGGEEEGGEGEGGEEGSGHGFFSGV